MSQSHERKALPVLTRQEVEEINDYAKALAKDDELHRSRSGRAGVNRMNQGGRVSRREHARRQLDRVYCSTLYSEG